MAYGDFKDVKRIKTADKALRDKTPNYDGYQRACASLFYKCFDKKTLFGTLKSVVICYEELAEELSKPSIRKFEKCTHLLWTIFGVQILKDLDFFMRINIYRKYA